LSRSKGISTVVGAAIFVAIVFTIIFPLILYLNTLHDLYMREASSRLSYEVERFNEKLEIHASIGLFAGRHALYVLAYNPSQLEVKIVAFYIESKQRGIVPIELSNPIVLAPGASMSYHVPFTMGPDDEVTVKAVTARGRSYTAPETRIGPRHLPYILFVTVENMSLRKWYKVKVAPDSIIGCVSPGSSLNEICNDTASYIIVPPAILRLHKFNNEKPIPIGYAFFHVAPGSYTISLFEIELGGSSKLVDHVRVNVTDGDVHVLLKSEFGEPLTTMTVLLASNNTVTLIANGILIPPHPPEGDIVVPFTISLGNASEPLENVTVTISSYKAHDLDPHIDIRPKKRVIHYMLPGESYSSFFIIHVKDLHPVTPLHPLGGWLEYSVKVSGKRSYTNGPDYTITVKGRSYVCVVVNGEGPPFCYLG